MKLKNWVKKGLYFGIFMYIFNVILFPYFSKTDSLTYKKMAIGIPVWLISGLLFGYFTRILTKNINRDI